MTEEICDQYLRSQEIGTVGAIPPELGQCKELTDVQLHGTKLTHCPDTLLECAGIIGKITLPLDGGQCTHPPGLNAKSGPGPPGKMESFQTWLSASPKPKVEGGGGGGVKLTAEGSAAGRPLNANTQCAG